MKLSSLTPAQPSTTLQAAIEAVDHSSDFYPGAHPALVQGAQTELERIMRPYVLGELDPFIWLSSIEVEGYHSLSSEAVGKLRRENDEDLLDWFGIEYDDIRTVALEYGTHYDPAKNILLSDYIVTEVSSLVCSKASEILDIMFRDDNGGYIKPE